MRRRISSFNGNINKMLPIIFKLIVASWQISADWTLIDRRYLAFPLYLGMKGGYSVNLARLLFIAKLVFRTI